jgi:hypothetical protein
MLHMSVEYDLNPKATHDAISTTWLQRWIDLHNPLHNAGYCLDLVFHSHDHLACAEALKYFYDMCNLVYGTESAVAAKAQLDWNCAYKAQAGILQNEALLIRLQRCLQRHGMRCT